MLVFNPQTLIVLETPFYGEPQDTPRQLVRLHCRVADRLERKPRFIESRNATLYDCTKARSKA
jgi:hypothetical protein